MSESIWWVLILSMYGAGFVFTLIETLREYDYSKGNPNPAVTRALAWAVILSPLWPILILIVALRGLRKVGRRVREIFFTALGKHDE